MGRQPIGRKPAVRPRDQQPDEDGQDAPDPVRDDAPEPPPAPAPKQRCLMALDVGYSNLKLLAGAPGASPAGTVLPAGAGPATALPLRPGGGNPSQDGRRVEVEGIAWVAGVEPSRLSTLARELHPDYPATAEYRALVHAALLAAGEDRIDLLVTGLPVDQWRDAARCAALRDWLTGTHQVTAARRVTVAAVDVLAQPIGAYLDLAENEATMLAESRLLLAESRVLVVDFGILLGGLGTVRRRRFARRQFRDLPGGDERGAGGGRRPDPPRPRQPN